MVLNIINESQPTAFRHSRMVLTRDIILEHLSGISEPQQWPNQGSWLGAPLSPCSPWHGTLQNPGLDGFIRWSQRSPRLRSDHLSRGGCWNPNRDRALYHALVTSVIGRLTDLPRLPLKNVLSGLIMTVAKMLLGSLFAPVLTILISTEFNVVALPFCKLSYFESEIPPLSPILRTLLLVPESLSSTYYQVLTT